ncbi:MAG: hypothetical protein WC494_02205 [Candidatus Pacearchaeota archaeon]
MKKQKVSVSVDNETLEKIDLSILKRKFRNRSHAFEFCINEILGEENEKRI